MERGQRLSYRFGALGVVRRRQVSLVGGGGEGSGPRVGLAMVKNILQVSVWRGDRFFMFCTHLTVDVLGA